MNNKEEYYKNTAVDFPHKNVEYFIKNIHPYPGKATDIGCGAGRDTVFLLQNGWEVVSIDKEDTKKIIENRLSKNHKYKFKFLQKEFNDIEIEKSNLIVANYSLSFCDSENIDKLWKTIVNSIDENGYFVGNFFGINDEWENTKNKMSFFTKQEVVKLFKEFNIIQFNEIEKDAKTGLGKMKHWHIFNIIAQKIR